MNWLTLFFALELGLVPQAGVLMYEPVEALFMKGVLYTELEAEVLLFDVIFAKGGVRTYVVPNRDDYGFSPNSTIYDFGAGLRFKNMLELGWRHRCFHPTIAYLPIFEQEIKGMEGSYDEVYLRMQVSTK